MITDDLHRALIRALSVLYFGSDEFMQQLAENEFADCASTQRDKLTPLKEILDSDLPKRDSLTNFVRIITNDVVPSLSIYYLRLSSIFYLVFPAKYCFTNLF